MLKIIYYIDSETEESPIKNNIQNIKKESARAKVRALIVYVADKDGIGTGLTTKNIRGFHFSEVRIKVSKDLYRVLYFNWQGGAMVLLHIFLKREGQQTPMKALIEAERRYWDFINNKNLYI